MKYKKYNYLIFLVLMLVIGINSSYATSDVCYYKTTDNNTSLKYNVNTKKFIIVQRQGTEVNSKDPLKNANKDINDWSRTGIKVKKIESSCPEYVVYRHDNFKVLNLGNDSIWGFENKFDAQVFLESSTIKKSNVSTDAWLLSYKNTDGSIITEEQFNNIIEEEFDCDTIFGSKEDPDSIRYLMNEILMYPKIIVPILVILLGTLDLAKAVMAGKEEEMRKAQTTFIKRLLIGIAIFFVPTIIDIIMYFTDLVWQGLGYSSCGI